MRGSRYRSQHLRYGYDDGIGTSLKTLSKTTYDAAGRTKTEQIWASGTEIRQSAHTYEYLSSDPDHALKVTTSLPDPDYGGPRTAQTEQRFYDDASNLVKLIDARNHTTTHTYDARNQRRSTTDAAQDDWSYDYDLAGNRTATVDPAGVTTARSFDFLSRKVSATIVGTNGQSLPSTTWERDARGDVTKRTEPDGSYVRRTYDAFGGVLQETAPVGPNGTEATRSYTYDPDGTGFLVAVTDFKNHTTTYGHDDMGRITTVVLPRAGDDPPSQTTYTYNAAGELTGVSIPTLSGEAPVTWAFGHDQLGRTDEVTDGVSNTTTTIFNRAGEAVEVADPRGITIAMSYDAWGNLIARAATDTATANPVPGSTETFTYGPYGNLKSADNQHAGITATYDGLVRLATVTVDSELTTAHTYQDARLAATTDAAGTTTYTYDAFGRPRTITDAITGAPTTYTYDQAQLESRSDPAGLDHAFSYDPAGRLDEEVVTRTTQGQQTEVARFETTYDRNSRVTTRLSEIEGSPDTGQWSYGYDLTGRLIRATDPTGATTTYTYDGAGNRIALSTDPDPDSDGDEVTTTTTYDAAARPVESSDGTTYDHDASGNLTGIDTPAQGFSFTYDPYVRLTGATASAQSTETLAHTYAHDALDRTTTKTTDALSPLGPERISEQTTTYQGLGEVLAERTTEQVAASTVVASVTETYGHALEGPVALQTTVATTIPEPTSTTTVSVLGAGPHTDLNYTADQSGVITGTKTYDPWGVERTDSAAIDGGLGFQSDPTDEDTGLTDMGVRHYLADLGRFTTPDPYPPSVSNPASFNPYVYVEDDPVSFTDPTGLHKASQCPDGDAANCPEHSHSGPDSFTPSSPGHVAAVSARGWSAARTADAQASVELLVRYHFQRTRHPYFIEDIVPWMAAAATLELDADGNYNLARHEVTGLARAVLLFIDSSVSTWGFGVAASAGVRGVVGSVRGWRATRAAEGLAGVSGRLLRPGPYAAESIPARGASQSFNTVERAAIDQIGYRFGCHTCGTIGPGTKSGHFIPDHMPVSALNWSNAAQRLYPQCLLCSREQGLAVARLLQILRGGGG